MNVEETKIMRMSWQPSPIPIMVDQKQLENVGCLNCVGSVITNDAECVCVCVCVLCVKLDPRLSWQKRHSTRRRLFSNKLDIFLSQIGLKNLRAYLVKCYIWNVAFCGAETWTFRKNRSEIAGKF